MKVREEDVRYVADLANLELTPAESMRMQRDLNSILEYIDTLSELNTEGVPPMAQVAVAYESDAGYKHAMRDDEKRPSLSHGEALKNSPAEDTAFFKVPKVIEK